MSSATLETKLQSCPLFKELKPEELRRVLAGLPYRVQTYEAGELVMLRGDTYDSLCLLLSGTVSAEMQSIEGKTMRVEQLNAPELLASAVLFATRNRAPVTVSAAAQCEVMRLSREAVLDLCGRHRSVLAALLRDAGNRVVFLAERMRLSQFTSIRQKLAIYLLERAKEQSGEEPADGAVVRLTVTRREMSELFGVTRPSLSRELGQLADEGILAFEEREHVRLVECRRLFELASEWE